MTGRLVLVRHGQSHANVERRLDTRLPGAPLTDVGRDQARGFARRLRRRPGLIAHSVAVRATQTADEISGHVGTEAVAVEGLHEVQVGELEDRSDDDAIAEFNAIYQRWHLGDHHVPLPGGESALDVLDRYLPVITELRKQYLDHEAFTDDIVVVSHGAAIRLVSAVLAGVDAGFAIDNHLNNAEAVVLAPTADGWNCLRWGASLPPFAPEPPVDPVQEARQTADPMG